MKYFNIISQEEIDIDSETQLYLVCAKDKYFIRAVQKNELELFEYEPIGRQDRYWLLPDSAKNNCKIFFDSLLKTNQGYSANEIAKLFGILSLSLNFKFFKKKSTYPMSIIILANRIGLSEDAMYEIYSLEDQNKYMNLAVCARLIEKKLMTIHDAIELSPVERRKIARLEHLILAIPQKLTIPQALAMEEERSLSIFISPQVQLQNNNLETNFCSKCIIF